MQEERVHTMLQAQPAPEVAGPVIPYPTTIRQDHVDASNNLNTTIASVKDLDLLLSPLPKAE